MSQKNEAKQIAVRIAMWDELAFHLAGLADEAQKRGDTKASIHLTNCRLVAGVCAALEAGDTLTPDPEKWLAAGLAACYAHGTVEMNRSLEAAHWAGTGYAPDGRQYAVYNVRSKSHPDTFYKVRVFRDGRAEHACAANGPCWHVRGAVRLARLQGWIAEQAQRPGDDDDDCRTTARRELPVTANSTRIIQRDGATVLQHVGTPVDTKPVKPGGEPVFSPGFLATLNDPARVQPNYCEVFGND